jgi:hypothetical protein
MFWVWRLGDCCEYSLAFIGMPFNDDSSIVVDLNKYDRKEKESRS